MTNRRPLSLAAGSGSVCLLAPSGAFGSGQSLRGKLSHYFAAALLLAATGACRHREEPGVLLAYIAVAGNNHVQVVDLESGKSLRKIYSGATPWRLVPAPDGESLWVQHWLEGTTAVVDLPSHEIVRVLPVRGPGVFSADGGTFLSFDWPGSALDRFDGRSFERREERVTEIPQVYDLAPASDGKTLYMIQFDPQARGPRERFGYALSYPLDEKDPGRAVPVSLPTGRSPAAIRVLRNDPFLLTADRETNGLTLLNTEGDGRAVPACPAPRAILLSPDETRLIVPCWQGDGARQSTVLTYRVDFSTRPWPTLVQEGQATLSGALVAGAFSPSGDRVYLVDRAGNRLLEALPATLELVRQIPTGDLPVDVAVVAVSRRARDRAAGASPARQALAAILGKMRAAGRPFTSLSWSEMVQGGRSLRASLAPPDRFRVETEQGSVRLAVGGDTVSFDRSGRFSTAPRQELLGIVYNLPNLAVDEAIRQLAGDVPGSPYLRGGIAVDRVVEIEQEGSRRVLVGAAREDERVSRLSFEAGTGRPLSLVERFPAFQPRGHTGQGFGGGVETRFYDTAPGGGGVWLPARLERTVDGGALQRVSIVDVQVNPSLPAESFDLVRFGGAPLPPTAVQPVAARTAVGGPGTALPIQRSPYLSAPGEPHPPYNSSPPTSGPRLAYLADWGIHRIPVPLELQAHNLEHGGVLLQYNCPRGCPDLVERLESLARERDLVLVAPYPWTNARLTLTAWGRLETLEGYDDERIRAFLDAYLGRDHHAEGGGAEPAGEPPRLLAAH